MIDPFGSSVRRTAMAVIALVAWFAVLLQLLLIILGAVADAAAMLRAIVNFFSFFTILTNLLVAFGLSLALLASKSLLGHIFAQLAVESGTGTRRCREFLEQSRLTS